MTGTSSVMWEYTTNEKRSTHSDRLTVAMVHLLYTSYNKSLQNYTEQKRMRINRKMSAFLHCCHHFVAKFWLMKNCLLHFALRTIKIEKKWPKKINRNTNILKTVIVWSLYYMTSHAASNSVFHSNNRYKEAFKYK